MTDGARPLEGVTVNSAPLSPGLSGVGSSSQTFSHQSSDSETGPAETIHAPMESKLSPNSKSSDLTRWCSHVSCRTNSTDCGFSNTCTDDGDVQVRISSSTDVNRCGLIIDLWDRQASLVRPRSPTGPKKGSIGPDEARSQSM